MPTPDIIRGLRSLSDKIADEVLGLISEAETKGRADREAEIVAGIEGMKEKYLSSDVFIMDEIVTKITKGEI